MKCDNGKENGKRPLQEKKEIKEVNVVDKESKYESKYRPKTQFIRF